MVIYNVTTHIEASVEQEWLHWMKVKHLPDMLATKKFIHSKIFKIVNQEDQGGVSYAVQYHCENKTLLDQYIKEDAVKLRKEGELKFGNRILYFRTELLLIDQQS